MSYLLDTDIIVYWLNNVFPGIQHRIDKRGHDRISISAITVAELYFGAYNSSRTNENLALLEELITELPVRNFDEKCGVIFGRIKAQLKRSGQMVNDSDLFIASIALQNDLCLVTNNVKHFERIERLTVENWIN